MASIGSQKSNVSRFLNQVFCSMKLAILGTDSDILQLAAAARSERHEIVWLGDVRAEDAVARFHGRRSAILQAHARGLHARR